VTGIVLAGGRSARFGRDKLSVPDRGRPLLHHAVSAVGACCEEVLVAVAPGRDPADPVVDPEALAGLVRGRARVVRDPAEGGGPLVGVRTGLEAAATDVALVVGGDMPDLVPAVLDDLLERLSIGHAAAVALDDGAGVRPLPAAVRTAPALTAARELLARGEGSLRALLRALDVLAVDRETWARLDPDAATLRDVDRPADRDRGGG
jgi:molybdopterin-guanine dinucleotide biosynthesis protein A